MEQNQLRPERRSGSRLRLKRLGLVVIGLVVGLGLSEATAYLYDEWFTWLPYRSPPPYRQDENNIRLAVLGGSTAHGSPYFGILREVGFQADFNLLSTTKFFLQHRYEYPEIQVDAYTNGGWPVEEAVKSYWKNAEFKPDVLVLYAGHNERWSYYSSNMKAAPGWLSFLSALNTGDLALRTYYTLQADQDDRDYHGEFFSTNPIPEYEAMFNKRRYRRFVELLARHCKSEGILLILILPESNYLYPPTRSVYRGPASRRAEALQAFKRAYLLNYVENEPQQAIEILERTATYCDFADLHFVLGEVYYSRGEMDKAKRHLGRAIDLDASGLMPSSYKDELWRIIERYQVSYIDMHDVITQQKNVLLPDYSSFIDMCHFRPHVYGALGKEIIRVLRDSGFDRLALPRRELSIDREEWSLFLGLSPELVALGWLSANHWVVKESGEAFLRLRRLEKAKQVYLTLQEAGYLDHLIAEGLPEIERRIQAEKERLRTWLSTTETGPSAN